MKRIFFIAVLFLAGACFGLPLNPSYPYFEFTPEGVRVTWENASGPELAGYNLYLWKPSLGQYRKITPQPLRENWVVLGHLRDNLEYRLKITSLAPDGSESSGVELVISGKAPPPRTPSGFRAEATDKGLRLLWDKPGKGAEVKFKLYLADEAGQRVKDLSPVPLTENSVSLFKLPPGKKYRFVLTAIGWEGRESAPTPPLEAAWKGPAALGAEKTTPAGGYWFLGFSADVDVPGRNWQQAYAVGPGEELSLGYALDPSLAFFLGLGGFYYQGINGSGNVSDLSWVLLPSVRFAPFPGDISPYLRAGGGVDVEYLNGPAGQGTLENADACLGLGFKARLTEKSEFYVEGDANFLFLPGATAQDIPVRMGIFLRL